MKINSSSIQPIKTFSNRNSPAEVVLLDGPWISGNLDAGFLVDPVAVTVYDTIFVRTDQVQRIASESATQIQKFNEVSNYLARPENAANPHQALLNWVVRMPENEKIKGAAYLAMYVCATILAETPLTFDEILRTEIAHEAGHLLTLRMPLAFNSVNPAQIRTMDQALFGELNHGLHQETCGYRRQLHHGNKVFTLFDLLYALHNPDQGGSASHLFAKQQILNNLCDTLLGNTDKWPLPIERGNPSLPERAQMMILLPSIVVQQPDILDVLIEALTNDHINNRHTANLAELVRPNMIRAPRLPIETAKQANPESKGRWWFGGSIAAVFAGTGAWIVARRNNRNECDLDNP